MISKRMIVWVVLPALLIGTAAHGTIWETDFSTMTGTDNGAVTTYTDDQGLNPRSYTTWANPVPSQPDPWLYKGTGPWGATASFDNQSDNSGGRTRHYTEPYQYSNSFDLAEGVTMGYRLRVGSHLSRGPFEFRSSISGAYDGDASNLFGASIRLRNADIGGGPTALIDIQRDNNPHSYHHDYSDDRHITWYDLGVDMTNVWAEWSVAAKYNPTDTTAGFKWTYVVLCLDGQLIQFDGPSGGLNLPEWEGRKWSFRIPGGHGGAGGPMVAIGNVNTQDVWRFDVDYVNYRDDGVHACWVPEPASLLLLAFGTLFLRRRRS